MIRRASLVLLFLATAVAANELPDDELIRYIEAKVAADEYVGIVVGYYDGGQTYVQSFGSTARTTGEAPARDTLFEISSVSKTFVAYLLADAVLRKELALDDPVNRYLPAGTQIADHDGRPVTLLDLAAHHSGLPDRPATMSPGDGINPWAGSNTTDLQSAINNYEPDVAAGNEYRYSAFGYAVLALALENHLDRTLDELIRERITTPLGMRDTVFEPGDNQVSRLATGYTPEGDVATPFDQGIFRAAGSMYSTLDDLLAWARLQTDDSDSHMAKAARLSHRLHPASDTLALAWHRTPGYTDRSQYGTANGYRAFVGFLTDQARCVVVLANTRANVMDIGNRLLLGSELPE